MIIKRLLLGIRSILLFSKVAYSRKLPQYPQGACFGSGVEYASISESDHQTSTRLIKRSGGGAISISNLADWYPQITASAAGVIISNFCKADHRRSLIRWSALQFKCFASGEQLVNKIFSFVQNPSKYYRQQLQQIIGQRPIKYSGSMWAKLFTRFYYPRANSRNSWSNR